MDHLQLLSPLRLTRAFCVALFPLAVLLFAPAVSANYPARLVCEADWSGTGALTRADSCPELCAMTPVPTTWNPSHWSGQGCFRTDNNAKYAITAFYMTCQYGGAYNGVDCSGTPSCPAGQTFNSATAKCEEQACAPGQVRNTITNECQPPCPAAGAAGGSNYVSPWAGNAPTSICRDGCSLTVGQGFTMPWSTGMLYGVSGLVHTGQFCNGDINGAGEGNGEEEVFDDPSDPPPITVTPDDDPPRCKAGECPGEVNGVYVCVPCGAAASETKPVKTFDRKTETTTTGTPPNETTQTKTTDTVAKHDGSGTVTSTTSTTTTTTGPNGTTTDKTTQEKKEPQESFCKDNPTSAFCKEGKWGGSCGSFTCSGDAVQCALAREVHQRNCEAASPNTLTNLADTAAAGTDPASIYIQAQKDAAPISAQSKFNESLQSSPIAGACPSPRSIAVPGGYSFEISFEKPCEFAGYLGFFIQAFAYLSAALIVLRNPTV